VGIAAQTGAEAEDLRRGGLAVRGVEREADAGPLGGPALVAHVGRAGGVVPAEHDSEMRCGQALGDHGRHLGRDLRADRPGDGAAVDDGRAHPRRRSTVTLKRSTATASGGLLATRTRTAPPFGSSSTPSASRSATVSTRWELSFSTT